MIIEISDDNFVIAYPVPYYLSYFNSLTVTYSYYAPFFN